MVPVDSSHPDQDDRFPPEAKKLPHGLLLCNPCNAIHFAHRIAATSRVSVGSSSKFGPSFVQSSAGDSTSLRSALKQPLRKKIPRRFEISRHWVICHW
jgi:hypothetical protein